MKRDNVRMAYLWRVGRRRDLTSGGRFRSDWLRVRSNRSLFAFTHGSSIIRKLALLYMPWEWIWNVLCKINKKNKQDYWNKIWCSLSWDKTNSQVPCWKARLSRNCEKERKKLRVIFKGLCIDVIRYSRETAEEGLSSKTFELVRQKELWHQTKAKTHWMCATTKNSDYSM